MATRPSSFAQQLKQYRRQRGLTQEKLAERAGLSARGIRALEGGKRMSPYLDTVRLLADALSLMPDERVAFEGAARAVVAASTVKSTHPVGGFLGASPAGDIVARAQELQHLLRILSAVQSGAGQVVMLAGEPGIGKTRLAQEVGSEAQARGFLLGSGRCYEPEQAVPYYPFLEALLTVHCHTSDSIRAQVPVRWPQLQRLLPNRPPTLREEEMGGPDSQQRLFWAVSGFLGAVAERRPLALLLDDLHWADASSLHLLQHLARQSRGSRVLLLGTYRDTEVATHRPLKRTLHDLRREGLLKEVAVGPLDQDGTAALATSLLGTMSVSEELVGILHRHTDGNPFFTLQVAGALAERRDVFFRDGSWDRRAVEEVGVPKSIRSAIGERVSRLHVSTQEVLREASILRQPFLFEDLWRLRSRTETEVEAALDEAMTVGLIQEIDLERYAFDHALTQQALYGGLGIRQRLRLHLAAGAAIERLSAHRRDGRAAELAWHFLQGGDVSRSLLWSLRAGDAAEEVFAHSEAESHYRRAVQLARDQGETTRLAEALEKQAGALAFLVRYDEQIELLEQAVGLLQQLGDHDGEMRVIAHLGWAHANRGTWDEGIARLLVTLEHAEDHGVGPAAVHTALANLYLQRGEFGHALSHAERGITLARQAGDRPLLGRAECRRGLILARLRRDDEAVQAYEAAVALAEETGDVDTLARSLLNLGSLHLVRANLHRARQTLARNLVLARRIGGPHHLCRVLLNQGDLAFFTGAWETVEEYWREGADTARIVEPRRMGGTVTLVPGLRMLRDADESAVQELEGFAAQGVRAGDAVLALWSGFWLAQHDLAQDQPERVPGRFKPVLTDPALEVQDAAILTLPLGEAYARLGRLEEAEALVNAHREGPRGPLMDLRQHVHWQTVLGIVRTRQERWDEARASLATALTIGDVAYLYGLALYYRGDMHLRRGEIDQAEQSWHEARDLFRRFPARLLVEWAERALARL